MAISIGDANIIKVQFVEQGGAPATPATGKKRLYATPTGYAYIDSSGTIVNFMDSTALANALKAPPPIGGITPNSGAFTNLSASMNCSFAAVTATVLSLDSLTAPGALNILFSGAGYSPMVWSSTGKMTHRRDDPTTNSVFQHHVIEARSTGTPTISFGAAIDYQLESSTTQQRDAARISWDWLVATDSGRRGELWLSTASFNGWHPGLSLGNDGTNPLVGLYGQSPVARPSYAVPSGSADRSTAWDTATIALPDLAQRVKAIIDDMQLLGLFA